MAVKLAVTGAVAAAGGGTKAAVAGSSSSDSDVNDSDLDSDSEGEHEELRAVVDRMMKDESDEDDDGGGPAPRCARRSFFFAGEQAPEIFLRAPHRLPHACVFSSISKTHYQRCCGTWIAPGAAF